MSNNGFDASIGLAFSLELFQQYRRTGVMQAELPRVPGVRGRCKASLQLIDGEVISVYLEDKRGHRYSSDAAALCRLDEEKGPFEWQLHFQSQPTHSSPSIEQSTGKFTSSILSSDPLNGFSVPGIVSRLPYEYQLQTWTAQRRDDLYILLSKINGKNTVDEIKNLVPYSPEQVDALLCLLLKMRVISILL